MVALDDMAARFALAGPVVLKVDVEGAEPEVLAGATGLLGAGVADARAGVRDLRNA
ncbi:MAG: FkbM family methyltransferase [Solirubrobacteraceae bacterium]